MTTITANAKTKKGLIVFIAFFSFCCKDRTSFRIFQIFKNFSAKEEGIMQKWWRWWIRFLYITKNKSLIPLHISTEYLGIFFQTLRKQIHHLHPRHTITCHLEPITCHYFAIMVGYHLTVTISFPNNKTYSKIINQRKINFHRIKHL